MTFSKMPYLVVALLATGCGLQRSDGDSGVQGTGSRACTVSIGAVQYKVSFVGQNSRKVDILRDNKVVDYASTSRDPKDGSYYFTFKDGSTLRLEDTFGGINFKLFPAMGALPQTASCGNVGKPKDTDASGTR